MHSSYAIAAKRNHVNGCRSLLQENSVVQNLSFVIGVPDTFFEVDEQATGIAYTAVLPEADSATGLA